MILPFFLNFDRNLPSRILCVLFALCILASLLLPALGSSPAWLKAGSYAEYDFASGSIRFVNGTWRMAESQAVFQWTCMNREDNVAELNVSIVFNQTKFSAQLYVDVETRNVTLPNGAYVGKTFLWLPPDPAENETVMITDGVTAQARMTGMMATCQGAQQSFGAENGFVGGSYDLDTGMLIQSDFQGEPTLRALGIIDPGYHGSSGITDTNVDLGPREWLPAIVMALPYALPPIAFIIVFALVLRRRQQRRKDRANMKKTTHVACFAIFMLARATKDFCDSA